MKKINRKNLLSLIQAQDLSGLSFADIERLFLEEPILATHLPDNKAQIDPRNGDYILYVSQRANRPHDNQPAFTFSEPSDIQCPICSGSTTGIIDIAELTDGSTFINKNLYPVVFPFSPVNKNQSSSLLEATKGLHFLQWTSTNHNKDFHNLPTTDCAIVIKRLAALEEKLIREEFEPPRKGLATSRQVTITKNYGRLVGGSLAHGHQQIIFNNFTPRRYLDNQQFFEDHGELFSNFMLRQNPGELVLRDYGSAVLLVPYFMRRPYEMMLIMKETSRKYLFELNEGEVEAVAQGWQDAIKLMLAVMPVIGREPAYNILTLNGPGAGLYFEFLPYTQEIGGYELLGLYACQSDPYKSAKHLKELLGN